MEAFLQEAGHVLWHAFLDSLQILPFLFLTYLLMEWLEHKAGERVEKAVAKAGKAGPLFGGTLGLFPQCGFSAVMAGLFAGGVVSVGTVLAVFLATSDEMIAVFLGEGISARVIFTVLGIKLAVAVLCGFVADIFFGTHHEHVHIEEHCREEHCGCENGIWRSALHHALHVFFFILVINVALGAVLECMGTERLALLLGGVPVLSQCVVALVGLIPNCGTSVAIATLYAKGLLSAGAMLSGLLTGAGAGLLVLFKTNKKLRVNLLFVGALLLIGVLVGALLDYTGLAALVGL